MTLPCGNNLLFVGSVMVDIVAPVPCVPVSGEGVVSQGYTMRLGGCAFNSANAARQVLLGRKRRLTDTEAPDVPRALLLAPVGEGPFASFARAELERCGMPVFVPADAGEEADGRRMDCGGALCLVEPSGERTMITLPGIERCYTARWFAQAEAEFAIDGCSALSMCGYELAGEGALAMLDFADRHAFLDFWFAPGPVICQLPEPLLERVVARRAIWHLNDAEVCALMGSDDIRAAGQALCARTGRPVVVTAGARGCVVVLPAEGDGGYRVLEVPTNPVAPVDTIGAGDAHLGTLMAARACGYSWEHAAAVANRMAGAVCGVSGATLSDEEFADTGITL